jgi:hypothetical protein
VAKIREHDEVRLLRTVAEPPYAAAAGWEGTVIAVVGGGAAFVVEIGEVPLLCGDTMVLTCPADAVAPVHSIERRGGLSAGAFGAGGGGRVFVSTSGAGGVA